MTKINPMVIVLAIIVLIATFVIKIYNNFVRKTKLSDEAWSGVDVQLKRRYDLVPNLVETVKGYAKHEQKTLKEVVELRNAAQSAKTPDAKARAENNFSVGLRSIFALSENYPNLKADANFRELQKELTSMENEIGKARDYYNATVRELNIMIDSFPSNLIGKTFGFKEKKFFEIADAAQREPVKVKFD